MPRAAVLTLLAALAAIRPAPTAEPTAPTVLVLPYVQPGDGPP